MRKVKCVKCGKEAKFFHSKCCMAHFEGVIEKGVPIIVCEKCGKFTGVVMNNPDLEKEFNKKYKIK